MDPQRAADRTPQKALRDRLTGYFRTQYVHVAAQVGLVDRPCNQSFTSLKGRRSPDVR